MTSYLTAQDELRDGWTRYVKYTLFIILLSVPLLTLVSIDLSAYDASRKHDMTMELTNHTMPDAASFGRYFTWILFLITAFALYTVYREYISESRMITSHDRNGAEALSRLVYDGTLLYLVAGIKDKIWYAHQSIPPGVFLALIFGFSILYTVFFENLRERVTMTSDRIERSPSVLILVIFPALGVLSTVITYHLMTAWRVSPEFFGLYLGIVLLFIAYHIGLWLAYGKRFHLHHWYTGLFCAHACLFNTDASIVCQAAFMAVYIHGMCVFGPDPVVEGETVHIVYNKGCVSVDSFHSTTDELCIETKSTDVAIYVRGQRVITHPSAKVEQA